MFDDISLVSYAISAICVILIGIDKAGFGGGIGSVATPLLSLVMSPTKAAAILLPLLCGADLVSICFYRNLFCRKNLKALLPGALVGIALGTICIAHWTANQDAAQREMRMAIGWISLLFVVYQVLRVWIFKRIEKYHPRGWHGWLFGSGAGFFSTLAHAGGPPVTMYLLPQHLDRQIFVGTMVWLFTAINASKLLPYWWLGLFPKENLGHSLVLMPLIPVGVGLGVWLNRVTSPRLFNPIVYAILFGTGLQLITGWSLADLFR